MDNNQLKLAAEETAAAAATATATIMGTTMIATVTATMTTTMTAAIAAAGGQRQLLMAWCGASIRWPKAAEMGIKQKWEQCGYDKIVTWVYFYSYPTAFHIY
jgi:hypothetical protein